MNQALALGPFVLPVTLLLALAALVLGTWAGRRMAREHAGRVEREVTRIVLAGLVAARIAFVAQFHEAYLKSPLRILDIRDGGWNAWIGLGVAAAYAAVVLARRAALRKPLAVAFGTGGTLWIAGLVVLLASAPDDVRIPRLVLPSLQGEPVALASFAGRPVVVNLWATWCPPCRREMPVLQQGQAAHPQVHFVFLNQGESPQKVAAYLQASGLQLRNVLLDARGEFASRFGHRALPTTLFFDASGRLVDTRVGELSEASLAQRLGRFQP